MAQVRLVVQGTVTDAVTARRCLQQVQIWLIILIYQQVRVVIYQQVHMRVRPYIPAGAHACASLYTSRAHNPYIMAQCCCIGTVYDS
jgi:hypothetical protein